MSRIFLTVAVAAAAMLAALSAVPAKSQQYNCGGALSNVPCDQRDAAIDAAEAQLNQSTVRVSKSFGALAYSEKSRAWNASENYPSAAKAKEGALGNCQAKSGGDCRLMLSFTNQCAAVARASAPGEDSANTGGTQAEAEANAVKSCRADWSAASCRVTLSSCSHHSLVRN